jgi:hypothetical protein
MVEGKVDESFGPTMEKWRKEAYAGKKTRENSLMRTVGLVPPISGAIRYQLLHRAASAVIEGERYRAVAALMLIHSFSEKRVGWSDYTAFLKLFSVRAEVGVPQRLPATQAVPLFAVWVPGDSQFLKS